jgi:hypothetical protein
MKTYVSFILDETGSMRSVKSQTIRGFNEYLATLKEKPKGVRFTLTQFNSNKVEVVHDGVKLEKVPELTSETYKPNNLTPLYDAIGRTINAIGDKENVIIAIQTDGEENHSKEYTREMIYDMIQQKQKDGWTFVFLGADIDAYEASARIGVDVGNVLNYAGVDTTETFRAVGQVTASLTQEGSVKTSNFAKLFEDVKSGTDASEEG